MESKKKKPDGHPKNFNLGDTKLIQETVYVKF